MKIKTFIQILIVTVLLASCASKKNSSNSSTKISSTKIALKNKNNNLFDFANYLGINKNKIENEKLFNYIDDWLGTPHKLGGTSKKGIDCSAFVKNIYFEIYNKNIPRTSQDMAKNLKTKKLKHLKEGDLIFFAFGRKKIDHVGIYLHNNYFVHVSTKKGVILSNIEESWYSNYFVDCGSIF